MTRANQDPAGPAGRVSGRSLAVAIVWAGILGACGGDSPEAMLESAKGYLAGNDLNAASIQLKNALQKDGGLAEARFLLGTVYLEQGDFAGAIRELRRAAQLGHPAEQIAPPLSRALLRSGEFDQVIKDFEWVTLADRAAQAAVLVSVGDAYLGKGEFDRAATTYQSAVEADARNAAARVGLGRTRFIAGDLDAAIASADAALEIEPAFAEAHALRADVLIARDRPADAIAALDAALKAQPRAIRYHFAVVSLLLREEDLDGAERRLEAMKRVAPRDPSMLYLKAFIDLRRERLAEAREAVAEVVRRNPDDLPAQLLAGSIHLRSNEHAVAQRHFEFVLARAPGQALARRLLAASLLATGESARAREVMQPLLDAAVDDPATLTVAGQVLLATGDFGRAADYFERVVAVAPGDAQARTRLGVSRLVAGDAESAFADLEAASRLDERLAQPDIALILANLRQGDFEKAMQAHEELARKQPDSPQTHNLKGGILLAQRDVAGARAAFERALELAPDFLAAAVNLARLDLLDNRPADARRRFEQIIASHPGKVDAYLLLAELLSQTGASHGDVRAVLERAVAANPSATAPRLAMVRFHLNQNEAARALALAQEVVAAHPDDLRALGLLARSQSAAGNPQQAVATLGSLVRMQPQSPGPLVALADAQRAVGDKRGAEQSLRRALGLRQDLFDAQQRLVALLLEERRVADALAVAREIQKQRPEVAAGFVVEGDIHAAANGWSEAVPAYRNALDRGGDGAVAAKLYAAQLSAGMRTEAETTARNWLEANPDDLLMRGHLAERALAEQRFEEAERHYRRMLEIRPDNVLVLNNLAWVAGHLKRPDAITLAERAVALAPDAAAVIDTLGVLQIDQGKHEEGLANLRRAVDLAPHLATLRLNLAKAYIALERKDEARRELDEVLRQASEGSPLQREADRLRQAL